MLHTGALSSAGTMTLQQRTGEPVTRESAWRVAGAVSSQNASP